MDLIDWPGVARNALWILGLSIVLAAWSYTSWWASMHRIQMRRALGLPRFQTPFALGLTLFVLTLALNIVALVIVRKYREQYE